MLVAAARYAELARINLLFAKAELTSGGNDPDHVKRAIEHILEADGFLRVLTPEFDVGYKPIDASGGQGSFLQNSPNA
jgi:NAD(P)H-dependent FMN reductase